MEVEGGGGQRREEKQKRAQGDGCRRGGLHGDPRALPRVNSSGTAFCKGLAAGTTTDTGLVSRAKDSSGKGYTRYFLQQVWDFKQ